MEYATDKTTVQIDANNTNRTRVVVTASGELCREIYWEVIQAEMDIWWFHVKI
jgi:predicted glutamine amidotransferase